MSKWRFDVDVEADNSWEAARALVKLLQENDAHELWDAGFLIEVDDDEI